ncbi:hypothetical protein [Pseudomonas rhodesiae]|uniref:hypothetical protein n=1 Tax=Pseudomonas rhodesiae TaxID=76760 RepID=UPI000693D33A|nr:hypothetical protein [Pseudomonas rhodesiae]
MPNFNTARIPAPESASEFEKIVNAAVQIRWRGTVFQRYGRPGQQQDGVDVYANSGPEVRIAIQCKNTCYTIPLPVVEQEVDKAEKFKHPIKLLYVATSQPNDRNIQDSVWKLSRERESQGKFGVSLLFWEDIISDLAKDPPTLLSFYPIFSQPDNDKTVLEELKSILPYNGSIAFVRSHGFCRRIFDDSQLNQLYIFWSRCDDPAFAFQDETLESLKLQLIIHIQKLGGIIGQNYTRQLNSELIERHQLKDHQITALNNELEIAAEHLLNNYNKLVSPRA